MKYKGQTGFVVIALALIICLLVLVSCDKGVSDAQISFYDTKDSITADEKQGTPDYTFSFIWNTYGVSSYDSETGVLVKTKDATNPEKYKTELRLNKTQYAEIWSLIKELDIESYPDIYNPHGKGVSIPYMTLTLSVHSNEIDKTVSVKETVMSYEAGNEKGQKFLDICKAIENILTNTEEWDMLPEYEFLYD